MILVDMDVGMEMLMVWTALPTTCLAQQFVYRQQIHNMCMWYTWRMHYLFLALQRASEASC